MEVLGTLLDPDLYEGNYILDIIAAWIGRSAF